MSADDVSGPGTSRSVDLLQDIQQRYPAIYHRRQQRHARQQALNITRPALDHELHVHFKDEKQARPVASDPPTPRITAESSQLNKLEESKFNANASDQRVFHSADNTKKLLHKKHKEVASISNFKEPIRPCLDAGDSYRTKCTREESELFSAIECSDIQKVNGIGNQHPAKTFMPRHSIQDRLHKNGEMLNSLLYKKPPFFSQRKYQQSLSEDATEGENGNFDGDVNGLVCQSTDDTAPLKGASSNLNIGQKEEHSSSSRTRTISSMSSLDQDYSCKDDGNTDQVNSTKDNKSFTEMCQNLCEQQKYKANIFSPELCSSCMSASQFSGLSKCTCSNLSTHLDSPCDSAIDVESTSIQSTVSLEKLSVQIPKTDAEGSDVPRLRFDGICQLPKMPDNQVKISSWQVEPMDFRWIHHSGYNGDASRRRYFSQPDDRQGHTQGLGEVPGSDLTTPRYGMDKECPELSSSRSSFGGTVRDDLSVRSLSSLYTDSDVCSNTPRSIYSARSNISTSGGTPRRIAMKWRVQNSSSKPVSVEDSGHSSERELDEIFFMPQDRQQAGCAFSTPRAYPLTDGCDDTDDTDPRNGIRESFGQTSVGKTRQKNRHYVVKRPQSTPLFGSAQSYENKTLDRNNRSVFIAQSTESVPGLSACLSNSKCDHFRHCGSECQTAHIVKKGDSNAYGERLTSQVSFGSSHTDEMTNQKRCGKDLLSSLSNEFGVGCSKVNASSNCWYSNDDRDIEFFMQAEFLDASMKPKKNRLKMFLKKKKGKYNPMLQEPPMKGDQIQRPVSMPNLLFDDTYVGQDSKKLNKSFDELDSGSTFLNGKQSILSNGNERVFQKDNGRILPKVNGSVLVNGNGCVLSKNNGKLHVQDTLPQQNIYTHINALSDSNTLDNACKPTVNTHQPLLHGQPMSVASHIDTVEKPPGNLPHGVGSDPETCSNIVLTSSTLADSTVCVHATDGDIPLSVTSPPECDSSSTGCLGPYAKGSADQRECGVRHQRTQVKESKGGKYINQEYQDVFGDDGPVLQGADVSKDVNTEMKLDSVGSRILNEDIKINNTSGKKLGLNVQAENFSRSETSKAFPFSSKQHNSLHNAECKPDNRERENFKNIQNEKDEHYGCQDVKGDIKPSKVGPSKCDSSKVNSVSSHDLDCAEELYDYSDSSLEEGCNTHKIPRNIKGCENENNYKNDTSDPPSAGSKFEPKVAKLNTKHAPCEFKDVGLGKRTASDSQSVSNDLDHAVHGSVKPQLSPSLIQGHGGQYIGDCDDGGVHDVNCNNDDDDDTNVNSTFSWSNASNCGSESLYNDLDNTSQEMSEMDTSGLSSKTFIISGKQESPNHSSLANVEGIYSDRIYENCFMNGNIPTKSDFANCHEFPLMSQQDVLRTGEHDQLLEEKKQWPHLKGDIFDADAWKNDFSSKQKRIQSFSYPCISLNLGFSRNSEEHHHSAQKRTQSLSCPSTPSHYKNSDCAGQISRLLFDLKNELIGPDAVSMQNEVSTDHNRGRESSQSEDEFDDNNKLPEDVHARRARYSGCERDSTTCDRVEKSKESDTSCYAAMDSSDSHCSSNGDSSQMEQNVSLIDPYSVTHASVEVKKPVKKVRTIFNTSKSSIDSDESIKSVNSSQSSVKNSNKSRAERDAVKSSCSTPYKQKDCPAHEVISPYATCGDIRPASLCGTINTQDRTNSGDLSCKGSPLSDLYSTIDDLCDGETGKEAPAVTVKPVVKSVAHPAVSTRAAVYRMNSCDESKTCSADEIVMEDMYAMVTKNKTGGSKGDALFRGDHCDMEDNSSLGLSQSFDGACGGLQDEEISLEDCPPVPDRYYKKNPSSCSPLKASKELSGSQTSLFNRLGGKIKSMKKAMSMDRGLDDIGKEEKKKTKEKKKDKSEKSLMSKAPSLKSLTSLFGRKKRHKLSATSDVCVDAAVQDPPVKEGKLKKCHKYLKKKSKPVPSIETVESPTGFRLIGKLIAINPDGSQMVELKKPPNGPIGFYIARGTANYDYGLLVSRFSTDNPEKLFAGILGIGDEILEINERSVTDLTLDQVYELMAASDRLTLKVFPLFARKDV